VSLTSVLIAVEAAIGCGGSHAIIGAVARNAWAPPRATTDLDLAIAARPEALDSLDTKLREVGYVRVREHRVDASDPLPDIVIFRSEEGEPRQVDLLLAKTPFEQEVIEHAEHVTIGPLRSPVASPEHLIVYKLLADRPRDRDDVRAVLRTQTRAARSFDWGRVERWVEFWQITERLRRLRADLTN
jgi:predicted nucleotidyltransferase